eukprot:TRINITY_DN1080_c1_g1_i10.p8 TRINITY_DN1080_c1_g1~~TRINITY_DN1080_c1_g1_i10.p8  ORF type:complete len:108 (+),score=3.95 TRINITY_DN1080_c1_g1_i10:674-997(+)
MMTSIPSFNLLMQTTYIQIKLTLACSLHAHTHFYMSSQLVEQSTSIPPLLHILHITFCTYYLRDSLLYAQQTYIGFVGWDSCMGAKLKDKRFIGQLREQMDLVIVVT